MAELLKYFLYLGSLGFGGPVALIGYMQRDLVEQRKWFSRDEYMKSLALAQLAPGPLAAQLAICLGYVHSRVRGATLVSLAFILPSFFMTVAISWLYVRYGGLSLMQAAFYGVGATVIGIITIAAYKLAKLTMAKDRLQWVIFALMAVVTAWTESEILWLFLLCGVTAMVAQAPPAWLKRSAPACLMVAASPELLAQIVWFFIKAGAFVFGSGLAIVPFLYGGVVQEYGWLNDQQFLDAVAVAMLTPGPDRHYRRLHRLSGRGVPGRAGRGDRRLPARLPVRGHPVSLVRSHQRQSEGQRLRRRRHGGGVGHDRRGLLRAGPARDLRRADTRDRRHGAGGRLAVQGSRAPAHRSRRCGRPHHLRPEIGETT